MGATAVTFGGMRLALTAAATAVVLLLAAAPAQSATLCVKVADPAGCKSTHNTLQEALQAAAVPAGERDTIRIGVTTLNESEVFQPNTAQNPVDIVGSGQGTDGTVMRSTTDRQPLKLGANSTVSNMRFVLPGDKGNTPAGLDLQEAEASDVTVVAEPGPTGGTAMFMRQTSAVRRVTVQMAADPSQTYGIAISGAGTHVIEDAVVTARFAFIVSGTTGENVMTVRRSRASGCFTCLYLLRGTLDISDSLLQVANEGAGVYVQPGTTATARNLTVVGGGGTNTAGFRANGSGQVNVRDSIIRGLPYALYTDGAGHLAIDYSDFDPDKLQKVGVNGLLAIGSHNVNVDPSFVDPGAGNFRLASGSPVADRASPGEGATAFDLDRAARLADANGDGNAVLDIGAYEYVGAPYQLPPVENTPGNTGGGTVGTGGGPAMQMVTKTAKLDLKRKVKLTLRCPTSEPGTCRDGYVRIATVKQYRLKKGGKLQYLFLTTKKAFKPIASGQTGVVTVTVPKTIAAFLRKRKKVQISVYALATGQANFSNSSVTELPLKAQQPKRKN